MQIDPQSHRYGGKETKNEQKTQRYTHKHTESDMQDAKIDTDICKQTLSHTNTKWGDTKNKHTKTQSQKHKHRHSDMQTDALSHKNDESHRTT